MSTVTHESAYVGRRRTEQKALSQIAERIAIQFPELATQRVVDAVQGHYAEFEDAPVRDFIPVLVERAVRTDLTAP